MLWRYLNGRIPYVRVGALLSPLLFALYTSDISLPVHPYTRVAIYSADRMIFLRQSHPFTMAALNNFISTRKGLTINAVKAKALLITKKRHAADSVNF
ncbi:hypothetical protein Zmor_012257 [Zophobas morio]|uniref:Reverse transcriptase domain-containing protein n=1 Tax=Zophobas morio TaxID=2755281 RepID=A0AA38HIT8_9CUCU|nr:hypothetical protein Zmor_012257 [Zophobas morio]